jgi:hypothetical protein
MSAIARMHADGHSAAMSASAPSYESAPVDLVPDDQEQDDSEDETFDVEDDRRITGKAILGYNVDYVSRVHLVYFRNERKNLQCFPYCQHFNEYSIGKLASIKHPSQQGTCIVNCLWDHTML